MIQVVNPGRGKQFFSYPKWTPTQSLIQEVLGAPSPGVKWLGFVADHLSLARAEVKNEWCGTCITSACLYGVAQANLPVSFLAETSVYVCQSIWHHIILITVRVWCLIWWFVLQILHQDALLKPLNMVQQFLTPLSNEDMSQQDNFKERQVSSVLNNCSIKLLPCVNVLSWFTV